MTILMQFSKIKCIFYDSFRESAPLGAETCGRESRAEQYRPVSLYDCLSFLLSIMSVFAFIFALIFISFICSSSSPSPSPCLYSALFVRSACVSKFIFLFVSTVNLMCLWHVLTVSSWRGYRRGYWQFMLTFFFILYIHHSVGLFSSTSTRHTCVWASAHLAWRIRALLMGQSMHNPDWKANCAAHSTLANKANNTNLMFVVMESRRISPKQPCK